MDFNVITLWRNFENRMIFERVACSWKNTVDRGETVYPPNHFKKKITPKKIRYIWIIMGNFLITFWTVIISNMVDCVTNHSLVVYFGFWGDFAANHNHTSLCNGFAGDFGIGIPTEMCVKDCVRNLIAHFVWKKKAKKLWNWNVKIGEGSLLPRFERRHTIKLTRFSWVVLIKETISQFL